jgi:HEAT repeat protein
VRSLAPSLIALLGDDSIVVRQAAALALGTLQSKESIPHLQATLEGDVPAVKMFAAVSLKRLGQANVDTFLAGLLNGQIAELRVIAAGAYQSTGPVAKNPTWEKAVRELMASTNEQHRLQAAEMLACCDAVAARTALTSALASANPLLRAGAAKIFEARRELADLTIARRIVGDALDPVRVYGNGLALVLAKDAASAPARGRGAAAGVSTNR